MEKIIDFMKGIINKIFKRHRRITFFVTSIIIIIILTIIISKILYKIENNVDVSGSRHGIVTEDNISFYKSAKESKFGFIDTLTLGEHVYIIDEKEDSSGESWYKIKSESKDRVGYIKKDSVDFYEMNESDENTLLSDVSKFDIQYENIKDESDFELFILKQNINYVYIRAGGRGYGEAGNFYYDTEYEKYISACEYLKIPYGFYYINNAKDDTEIKEEVEFMKDFIAKNKGDYYLLPVVIDLEDFSGEGRLDKLWSKRGELTQKVVDEFTKNDIDTIVYCNAKLANKYLKDVSSKFWVAYYDEKKAIPTIWYDETNQGKKADETFLSKIIAWQFTENGISDDEYKVDMSITKNAFFLEKIKEAEEKKKQDDKTDETNEVNVVNLIFENEVTNEINNSVVNNVIDNNVNIVNEVTENTIDDNINEGHMIKLEIGDKVFYATLYDNETTKALLEQFPIIMDMKELNGNEKYYEFSKIFPTKLEEVGNIKAGELMMYGSNCFVIFYDSLSAGYSYTKLRIYK